MPARRAFNVLVGMLYDEALEGADAEVAHKAKSKLRGELNRILIESYMEPEDAEMAPMAGLREAPLGVIED